MNEHDMVDRTKAFALRVIRLTESLPRTKTAEVLGRQILRSGTSVGSNYRAARRAKSRADFINKMGTVEEESDETAYWMELLIDCGAVPATRLAALLRECNEITAIVVATIRSAKRKRT